MLGEYITWSPTTPGPMAALVKNKVPSTRSRRRVAVIQVNRTSLNRSLHTAWPQGGKPAWPTSHSRMKHSSLFLPSPLTSPKFLLYWTRKWWFTALTHLHPSLTRPPTLLLHTVHTQKNEDPEEMGVSDLSSFPREFPFSLLTCTFSMFRNWIHKWYWRFQSSGVLKGAHNFLEGELRTLEFHT